MPSTRVLENVWSDDLLRTVSKRQIAYALLDPGCRCEWASDGSDTPGQRVI